VLTPSWEQVEKYLGLGGVAAYAVIGTLALAFGLPRVLPIVRRRIGERGALAGAAATVVVLLAVFLLVYPHVNRRWPGAGSDLDDELDLAAGLLLQGRDPYGARTYLGNPVDLLPGEILLALPFVATLGKSAYQNFWWLAAFWAAAATVLGSRREALLALWTMLAASPVVLQQVVTGGDHVTNALHVLVAIVLLGGATSTGPWGVGSVAGAALLGVGLSSRANFALLLPLVAAFLVRRAGAPRAGALLGVVAAIGALVTLPIVSLAPAGLTPTSQLRSIARFDRDWPVAQVGIPAAAAVLSAWLALRPGRPELRRLLGCCAIVQAAVVWAMVVVASIVTGGVALQYAGYGAFYLPFATVALWGVTARSGAGEYGAGRRAAPGPGVTAGDRPEGSGRPTSDGGPGDEARAPRPTGRLRFRCGRSARPGRSGG
jgi:hypothetical protein